MKTQDSILICRVFIYGLLVGCLSFHPLTGYAGSMDSQTTNTPLKTAKERLGSKATDNQRINNCKVPLDRRGSQIRPEKCKGKLFPPQCILCKQALINN